MTWETIVVALDRRRIGKWTRQALAGNARILKAYQDRKAGLAAGKTRRSRDPAMVVMNRQVEQLEAEIAGLKEKLNAYEERYAIMLRNASVRGLTEGDLTRPLHSIDRKAI